MKAQMFVGTALIISAMFLNTSAQAEDAAATSSAPAASSAATSSVNPDANYILCQNGKAVRTIRIEKKGNSCKAFYTKEGVDQMVGKSGAAETCQKVVTRIKTNLEAGDWKCKDISQARVSSSME